jgi:opacity protein-like surface antigen
MKTTAAKTLLILTAAACSFSAHAQSYVGAKSDRVMVSVDGVSLNYGGIRAVAGLQMNPNLAVEAHVGTGVTDAKVGGFSSELGAYYGVDLVGKLPLNDQFSLRAKVGYGAIEIDGVTDNDIRYGVGASYNLSKSTELSLGYERWFAKDGIEIDSLNVGVDFKF